MSGAVSVNVSCLHRMGAPLIHDRGVSVLQTVGMPNNCT